jgi:hypothetical protein
MQRSPAVRVADLDRLAERLAALDLSPEDRAVWTDLLALGREAATARGAAEAAGLVFGAPLAPALGGSVPDAFRRAMAPGARAIVGNVPPRR